MNFTKTRLNEMLVSFYITHVTCNTNVRYQKNNMIFVVEQDEGKVSTIDDSQQFQQVTKAMTVIELTEQEQKDIFAIVASVLHMGNVGFTEEEGKAKVLKPECVEAISKVTQKCAVQVYDGSYVNDNSRRAC
jgi:myosin heavy subunit